MIKIEDLTLEFADRALFKNVSCSISLNQKIGLVGSNGAGKSTLLKIIAGKQEYDAGNITKSGARIAYMPQEVVLQSHDDVVTETLKAFPEIKHAYKQLARVEHKQQENPHCTALAQEAAQIHHTLGELNVEAKKAEALILLQGLGFDTTQLQKKINQLSVGWRMRVILAQLLLQRADFYLFDEPTNHLDLQTKEWFLQFLQKSSWGYLLISHDTYFLRKATDYIFHVSQGALTSYTGNYDTFVKLHAEHQQQQTQAHYQQEKMIAEKMKVINKFRAKPSKAKMAQSMLKELQKVERIPLPEQEPEIHITLPTPPKLGRIAIQIKDLTFSYTQAPLLQDISFIIERGEKVAFIAPNGKGKTTLFNLLAKKLNPQRGDIIFDEQADIALFDQDQDKVLTPHYTIYQEVSQSVHASDQNIRTMLGCLLFSGDDTEKKISMLSGGERNRVAMAKILLKNGNILLLDEPTNHLDVMAKKILLQALQAYKGTIIFVAHDKDFVNQLATRIIEIDNYTTTSYQGNYDTYLAYKAQKNTDTQTQKSNTNTPTSKHVSSPKIPESEVYALRKECSKLERKIQKLEREVLKLEENMGASTYGSKAYENYLKKHAQAQEELSSILTAWEETMLQLEGQA